MKLFLVPTLWIVFLAGCSTVVPSSIAMLYQLTPLEADPADLAVALKLPNTLQVAPNSAKISFNAKRDDTGEVSDGVYELRVRESQDGKTLLDIDPSDHESLRAQQMLITNWEETAGEATSGGISVGFGGCAIGNGPAAEDRITVLIRTQAEGRFFPLVKNATVAQALNILELDEIEPCP